MTGLRKLPAIPERAMDWYHNTPKWLLAVVVMHLAAASTNSYDDAIADGSWLLVAEEETLLHKEAARAH